MTRAVQIAAANLILAVACIAQGTFNLDYTLGAVVPTGVAPLWCETGDINEDGLEDILVLNAGTADIAIFLNQGGMSFTPGGTLIPAAGPSMFEIGDLNNDGHLDVVVCARAAFHLSVFYGDGTGAFPNRGDYPVGFDPTSIALHDHNDDGFLDVLVASQNTHNMQIMINDQSGALALAASAWAGAFPSDIVVGDLDNDGDDDIVVAVTGFSSIMVIEKTATGYLPINFYPVGFGPLSVDLGDMNRDGYLDVITANVGSDDVSLLLNRSATTHMFFGGLRNFGLPAGRAPTRAIVTDVDNRNGLDVAVATINGSSISVLTNDFWGNLTSKTPAYFTGTTPVNVVAADLDNDLAVDLIALNLIQGDMMILENKLPFERYDGTNEDLELFTAVNSNPLTTGGANSIKHTADGDSNSWFVITPAGLFTSGATFLAVQGYAPGDSPYNDGHPGLYISPLAGPPAILPLGHLPSSGQLVSITLPAGVAPLRYVVQALSLSIFASNGYMATTDAHEFRVE